MTVIIKDPATKISPEILQAIKEQTHEEGQVIIHCLFYSMSLWNRIRIWPTTYLFDCHSAHTSSLVHAENITFYPQWMNTPVGDYFFTLIFTGLPKSCTLFDLIERCNNEHGAFVVRGIPRNEKDVYYIEIT
ncbi:MAG TPA: hypothetical protein PKC30_12435 [Saprospiraceae bacterium]|nr:hypothetical protein [Saprospiraceae bacterium]